MGFLATVGVLGCRNDPGAEATFTDGAGDSKAAVDLNGREVDPFAITNARALVFIFVSTDCPISNRYAPEYQRLERFASRGAKLWLVYANANDTADAIRRHLAEFHLTVAAIRDPGHALVRRARAAVTPEAAVFSPAGKLVYHGRIDDRFPSLGNERAEPTRHDLAEVLEAVLAGQPVPFPSLPAIGCKIPD